MGAFIPVHAGGALMLGLLALTLNCTPFPPFSPRGLWWSPTPLSPSPGCQNYNNNQSIDLTGSNGVCAFIKSPNYGNSVSVFYAGSSLQHKSGRYIYGDGMWEE